MSQPKQSFPFFPLYFQRFSKDPRVVLMTPAQRSYYLYLLGQQWFEGGGGFDANPEFLWVLAGAESAEAWEAAKGPVLAMFEAVQIDGHDLLRNRKMFTIFNEQSTVSTSRTSVRSALASVAGKASAAKRKTPTSNGKKTGQIQRNPTEGNGSNQIRLEEIRLEEKNQNPVAAQKRDDEATTATPEPPTTTTPEPPTTTTTTATPEPPTTETVKIKTAFQQCQELLFSLFAKKGLQKPVWNSFEAKALSNILDAMGKPPDLQRFARCVRNRLDSENKPITERPGKWLSNLTAYELGPLDKYGKLASDNSTPTEVPYFSDTKFGGN